MTGVARTNPDRAIWWLAFVSGWTVPFLAFSIVSSFAHAFASFAWEPLYVFLYPEFQVSMGVLAMVLLGWMLGRANLSSAVLLGVVASFVLPFLAWVVGELGPVMAEVVLSDPIGQARSGADFGFHGAAWIQTAGITIATGLAFWLGSIARRRLGQ